MHGGSARYDDPLKIKLTRDVGHVQSGGAAKGEQSETPRIDAAPHRDEPYPLGHGRVDDPVDSACGTHAVDAERRSDFVDSRFGGRKVEPAPSAEKTRRIEITEQ